MLESKLRVSPLEDVLYRRDYCTVSVADGRPYIDRWRLDQIPAYRVTHYRINFIGIVGISGTIMK